MINTGNTIVTIEKLNRLVAALQYSLDTRTETTYDPRHISAPYRDVLQSLQSIEQDVQCMEGAQVNPNWPACADTTHDVYDREEIDSFEHDTLEVVMLMHEVNQRAAEGQLPAKDVREFISENFDRLSLKMDDLTQHADYECSYVDNANHESSDEDDGDESSDDSLLDSDSTYNGDTEMSAESESSSGDEDDEITDEGDEITDEDGEVTE